MRLGLSTGFLPAGVTLEGVGQSLRAQLVDDPAESVFYKPFEQFPAAITGSEKRRLGAAAKKVIRGTVVPAYRALLQFLETEYIPGARQGITAADLPGGLAFYQGRIRHYTTLDLAPEAIHAIGQHQLPLLPRQQLPRALRL